jgi:alanine dehydrogenase
MIIGVPKEIKNNENRVAITPSGVLAFVNNGHTVLIERDAGIGSGFTDEQYHSVGAQIIEEAKDVWTNSQMIMKVKEPLASEYQFLRNDLILFTYLHLSAEPELASALLESKITAIAYETVEVNRTLPLLMPMSEIAGRMAVQIGAQKLEKQYNGKGILLGGVPGVKRGKVCIVGGGIVGTNAAKIAVGLGADVTIIDLNPDRLRQLDDIFGNSISTLMSNPLNIADAVKESDLVIGAVLIPGSKAPRLVTEETVQQMHPGSVIVDVAVDQGGIFETIDRVTTHDNPIYIKHDIIHYAVPNMPGAVPRTSTIALTNATTQYAIQIANQGIVKAIRNSKALELGINAANGHITYQAVAKDLGYTYVPPLDVL